jgi:uncharacterized membrane protein
MPDRWSATEGLGGTLRDNIEALGEREREDRAKAPLSERFAAAVARFAGSMTFVWIHAAAFGLWILINVGAISWIDPFDPSLVILAMIASVEAIFLTTFVLIGQNRMAKLDDRRADLDLQVSLLTEHELTRLAELIARIAEKLDVPVDRAAFAEIEQDIQPVEVLAAIDERRTREERT